MTVFCDWGTTNLRAYLLDQGEVIETFSSDDGLKNVEGNDYSSVLENVLNSLGADLTTPIFLSGMVGSKHGWKEAPYTVTPVSLLDLTTSFVGLDEFPNAKILGGISHQLAGGRFDVMRGEECQIFGLLEQYPDAKTICLPGTHSKWVRVEHGKVVSFSTWMTGDFFHCLSEHTIFKEQITSTEYNQSAFLKGLERAKKSAAVLNDAFHLRTDYLFSEIKGDEFHSYLSGFLIGLEVKGAVATCQKVHLCCSEAMRANYCKALNDFDIEVIEVAPSEASVSGMKAIVKKGA